jgi:hypothetical protein
MMEGVCKYFNNQTTNTRKHIRMGGRGLVNPRTLTVLNISSYFTHTSEQGKMFAELYVYLVSAMEVSLRIWFGLS